MTITPPLVTCPGCGALIEQDHEAIVNWAGQVLRLIAVQSGHDALVEPRDTCPAQRN